MNLTDENMEMATNRLRLCSKEELFIVDKTHLHSKLLVNGNNAEPCNYKRNRPLLWEEEQIKHHKRWLR